MRTPVSLLAVIASLLLSTSTSAVLVDGRDWRQLTETTSFSWNEIADATTGVCPAEGGECAGSLNGVDFTAWTWATVDEIGELFQSYNPAFPGGNVNYSEISSTWLPGFFADFALTGTGSSIPFIWGWSATSFSSTRAYGPFVQRITSTTQDFMRTETHHVKGGRSGASNQRGVWLYRVVPEPTTATLMGIALAGLGFQRRKATSPF